MHERRISIASTPSRGQVASAAPWMRSTSVVTSSVPSETRAARKRRAEEGARAYAAELAEHLELDDAGIPVLDVVHLGLGPDGHVASLFPDHPALTVTGWATVGVDDAPKPPPEKVVVPPGATVESLT